MRGMPRPWICSIAHKRMCNCMPPIRRMTGRSSGVPSDRSGRSPRANSSGRPRSRSMCARKDIG